MDELVRLSVLLGFAAVALLVVLTAMLVWEARRPPRHTAGWAMARGLPCDPRDVGLEFEDWWLHRPGAVRLGVWEVAAGNEPVSGESRRRRDEENKGHADAPGSAPGSAPAPGAEAGEDLTVVMVHGWGQGKVDLLSRLGLWRDLCDRMVLYDLRGHGDAEGSLSTLGCGEDEDLLALLAQLGEAQFVLVGISMGAVIAMAAAARNGAMRDRIAGIVAYGPYCDFHRSLRGRLAAGGYPARPISDLAMLWFRLMGIRHRPTEDAVRRLNCPVLVVHGTEDMVSPIAHGERLEEVARDAALYRVEGAGHMDAHAVDVPGHDEAVRGFVRTLPAVGG